MQELTQTEIQLPESVESFNVDQVLTVIQNGTQPYEILLYPQSLISSPSLLSVTTQTQTLHRLPPSLQQ